MSKSHSLKVKLEVLNWYVKGKHNTDIQWIMGLGDPTLKTILGNVDSDQESFQFSRNLIVTRVIKS